MIPEANPYRSPAFGPAAFAQRGASSGAIHWVLFPLAAFACLVISAAMAFGLALMFISGHYYILVVPLAAASGMAMVVYYSIRFGQCRNRWFGLLLGISSGCILYLGYYQFALAQQAGPAMLLRVDALPAYIAFRIQNDVTWDARRPDNGQGRPSWYMNTIMFAAEFGLVLWMTSLVGLRTASRAFDDARGQWAEVSYMTVAYGESLLLKKAHQEGKLAEFLRDLAGVPLQHSKPHCLFVLERFPPGEGNPPRAFLSAYEMRMPGQVSAINELLHCKRLPVRQLELTPAEMAAVGMRQN